MIKNKLVPAGQYSFEDLRRLQDEYTDLGFESSLGAEGLRVFASRSTPELTQRKLQAERNK